MVIEAVSLYLPLHDLCIIGLSNEFVYSLLLSPTWQRDYLEQVIYFDSALIQPWMGYFENFPEDDFEYMLYDLARRYIRRVCYWAELFELEALIETDREVFIFIADYGAIHEYILRELNICPELLKYKYGALETLHVLANYQAGQERRSLTEIFIGGVKGTINHFIVGSSIKEKTYYIPIINAIVRNVNSGSYIVALINYKACFDKWDEHTSKLFLQSEPAQYGDSSKSDLEVAYAETYMDSLGLDFDMGGNESVLQFAEGDPNQNRVANYILIQFTRFGYGISFRHDRTETEIIKINQNLLTNLTRRKVPLTASTLTRVTMESASQALIDMFMNYPYLIRSARKLSMEYQLASDL